MLGASYGSYDTFAAENTRHLREQDPLDLPVPLFFGNLFVQADGMIADTAALGKRMFALQKTLYCCFARRRAGCCWRPGCGRSAFVCDLVDRYVVDRVAPLRFSRSTRVGRCKLHDWIILG